MPLFFEYTVVLEWCNPTCFSCQLQNVISRIWKVLFFAYVQLVHEKTMLLVWSPPSQKLYTHLAKLQYPIVVEDQTMTLQSMLESVDRLLGEICPLLLAELLHIQEIWVPFYKQALHAIMEPILLLLFILKTVWKQCPFFRFSLPCP